MTLKKPIIPQTTSNTQNFTSPLPTWARPETRMVSAALKQTIEARKVLNESGNSYRWYVLNVMFEQMALAELSLTRTLNALLKADKEAYERKQEPPMLSWTSVETSVTD